MHNVFRRLTLAAGSYGHRLSHPYNAGTEHVGFPPTRPTFLAPSAKRREVFDGSHEEGGGLVSPRFVQFHSKFYGVALSKPNRGLRFVEIDLMSCIYVFLFREKDVIEIRRIFCLVLAFFSHDVTIPRFLCSHCFSLRFQRSRMSPPAAAVLRLGSIMPSAQRVLHTFLKLTFFCGRRTHLPFPQEVF